MEKLFEKILHEMRSSISVPLAFVVSFIVCIVDPKGIFQSIFEIIFQYIQNKILSFSLSFFFIFFFFYAIFLIFYQIFLWYGAKKYEQNERDKIYQKTAHQIHQFPDEIKKNFMNVILKNKIKFLEQMILIV